MPVSDVLREYDQFAVSFDTRLRNPRWCADINKYRFCKWHYWHEPQQLLLQAMQKPWSRVIVSA